MGKKYLEGKEDYREGSGRRVENGSSGRRIRRYTQVR